MRAWWAWLQVAQHEWWFVPAGLGLLAVTVAAVVLMRIAVSRASSWSRTESGVPTISAWRRSAARARSWSLQR